jgi:hypothetical protein
MAAISSAVGKPDRTVMASFGPIPLTEISRSNTAFSSGVAKPNNSSASSRTCVWMRKAAVPPKSASTVKVEIGIWIS